MEFAASVWKYKLLAMCLPNEASEGTTIGMQNPICHPKFAFGPRSNGIFRGTDPKMYKQYKKWLNSGRVLHSDYKIFSPLNIQITKSRKMQMQPKKL